MRVSLSEVETTVRKAALGVGLALGLAEDAGRAAGWAALAGVGDPGLFAAALEALDTGRSVGADADRAHAGTLTPVDGAGPLSALIAGPAACDALRSVAGTVTLIAVDHPAVVLFEALEICDGLAGELRVDWRDPGGAAIEVVRRARPSSWPMMTPPRAGETTALIWPGAAARRPCPARRARRGCRGGRCALAVHRRFRRPAARRRHRGIAAVGRRRRRRRRRLTPPPRAATTKSSWWTSANPA